MCQGQALACGKYEGFFYSLSQLSYIAWPGLLSEVWGHLMLHFGQRPIVALAKLLHEMSCQGQDVLHTLAQAGHMQSHPS
jgi:hypothetical protein